MMKMTKTKKFIIKYLKDRGWCSPTQIGRAYENSKIGDNAFHNSHSAWASPKCLQLTAKGILERNEKGHYRLKIMKFTYEDEIEASHPLTSDNEKAERADVMAMKLVGQRHSKRDLVDLVRWLIMDNAKKVNSDM